jgi:single-strand DNA-binding protein
MAETSVTLAGNLTDNSQLRYTPQGTAKATFRVAVSSRVRDGEQWRDAEPSFFTVVVWHQQAEHVAECLSKGARVAVVGRLVQRSWQADDGSTRSVVEVVAEELGPSLRWATATPSRATRPS